MNEDKVIQKLLEHDDLFDLLGQKLEGTMTKEDGREMKATLEQVVTIAKKIQDDHFFTIELYRRLQAEVDSQKDELHKQDKEIRKIKIQLKMA